MPHTCGSLGERRCGHASVSIRFVIDHGETAVLLPSPYIDAVKRFGDCTFAEVKAFGEQMSQIAEKIGPGRTVGELMHELANGELSPAGVRRRCSRSGAVYAGAMGPSG